MRDSIVYNPIGIIYTPFKSAKGTPIQPSAAIGIEGRIKVFDEYQDALKDLDGFSHLILLYHFHLTTDYSLSVKPFLDEELHGVFATRAPSRPNPIGISIVRLTSIQGNILYVQDMDVVNETPILDIKPYVPQFDRKDDCNIGWLKKNIKDFKNTKDNGRFL